MNKIFALMVLAVSPAFAQQPCAQLAGSAISAAAIKLSSSGATITAAQAIPASATLPAYCQLQAAIAPATLSGSPINLQINLPGSWNGKALEYGGGGFDGLLITGLAPLTSGLPGAGLPLAQGYATYGSDSGHAGGSLAGFALNPEALQNFAYAAYDKAHDVAVAVIEQYYGSAPSQSYFFGHSEGGREALAMAQLFPEDFSGIVAMSPVINWTALQAFGNSIGAAQLSGGWLPQAKLQLIAQAAVNACDGLDGVLDGVVSNYMACTVNYAALECPGGADTGNTCLSAAQLGELAAIHAGYASAPLAYPGFLYGGEAQTGAMGSIMGQAAAAYPNPAAGEGNVPWYGAEAIKDFIAAQPQYNTLGFLPGNWLPQVSAAQGLMDMDSPDLSAFYQQGGKLILFEGTADYAQSPAEGMAYYSAIENAMGIPAAQSFVRLYISPGTVHNGGGQSVSGTAIPAAVDLLGALDAWVYGTAPGSLIQYKQAPVPPYSVQGSRPLCQYGQYPGYLGGRTSAASSYSCLGTIQ